MRPHLLTPAVAALAGALLIAAAKPTASTTPTPPAPAEPEVFVVDASHSAILFSIKHLDVAMAYGRFNAFEGRIELAADATQSSVTIEIDTGSADSGNAGRDKHIMSPDFLNAVQFPKATFQSKQVIQKGDVYAITGDLNLHGVTKEVKIDMKLIGKRDTGQRFGYRAGFHGELEINRRDFGIEAFDDEMLSNEITLTFSIEAARK